MSLLEAFLTLIQVIINVVWVLGIFGTAIVGVLAFVILISLDQEKKSQTEKENEKEPRWRIVAAVVLQIPAWTLIIYIGQYFPLRLV